MFILVFLFSTGHSQITWKVLSSPNNPNEYITSSFITDEEGWLIDNTSVLWHTSDGCETLDTIFTGKNFSKLDFVDPIIGYALDASNVYKTTNGGLSWTALTLPGGFQNTIYFLNKDTGFVSGFYEYYRTTNGGASWTTLPMPGLTRWNDYSFINDSVGCAVTDDYYYSQLIYRTIDCGLTWTGVWQNSESHLYSIYFSSKDTGWAAGYYDFGMQSNEIVKTTDGGLTWQTVYFEGTFGFETLYDIRVKGNNEDGFAISDQFNGAITNDGENWYASNDIDTLGLPLSIAGSFNTLDGFDDMYMSGKYGTLLKWKKDTAQWQDISGRIASDIKDVSFSSNTHGWIASNAGLLKTTDGGITWHIVSNPKFSMNGIEAVNDSLIIAAQHYDNPQIIYRSTDGGQTWSTVFSGTDMSERDIQMIDENNGYILSFKYGYAASVWKTTDGGITWAPHEVANGWSSDDMWSMYFLNVNEGWVVYGQTGKNTLFHTVDGGTNWVNEYQYTGAAYKFLSVCFTDSQHGYLGTTGSNYFETSDGGVNWIPKSISGATNYLEMFFADSLNGWSLTKTDIYTTTDGGTTWSIAYHSETELYDLEYADTSAIYARGFYGFLVKGSVCDPLNTDYLYVATDLSIQFLNQITEATSFFWDFGDGTTSTQQNPLHTFPSSATYYVCLVESDLCTSDTMCKDLVVCGPLTTNFSFDAANLMVQFTDTSVNAVSWNWDFGDGSGDSIQNPLHIYPLEGTYNVCLTTYNGCVNDSLCQDITLIANSNCNANFILIPDSFTVGYYWGYNLSTGNNLKYSWTWGDGTTGEGPYPNHLYADSGFYTICLMIFDSVSFCADTFCADYSILKTSGMMGIHEINFVDYPVPVPQTGNSSEWNIYPNPFSSSTTISFSLEENSHTTIELYDLAGKKIKMLFDENRETGTHKIRLDHNQLPAGAYLIQMSLRTPSEKMNESTFTMKIIIE